MLKIENIGKTYGQLEVLKGVDLTIHSGEFVSIVGKSGAGKSTLIHIAGTLDKPTSGRVLFENKVISTLTGNTLSDFRNQEIGFIFQFHHLLPEFTAIENVMIPSLLGKVSKEEARFKAMKLFESIDLKNRINHKPGKLSGGEQQRVAIARSLMNDPKIVFADEPTGNLDSATSADIHDLFLHLNETLGKTFVIVTHNEKFASICNRQIEMKDGKIVQS